MEMVEPDPFLGAKLSTGEVVVRVLAGRFGVHDSS
jgi:hypothetical protein